MEQAASLMQIGASMAAVIAGLGAIGFAGAWLATRGQACNPYGINACACGCGVNCEDDPRG